MKLNEFQKTGGITRREFIHSTGIATGGATFSLFISSAGCASCSVSAPETFLTSGGADQVLAIDSAEILYSTDGIWVNDEGDNIVRMGITEHLYRLMTHQGAQGVNSIELPEPGSAITRGSAFGMLESSKMDIDLISPVSGKVIETGRKILSTNDVYEGWMLLVRLSNPEEMQSLISCDEYVRTYSSPSG